MFKIVDGIPFFGYATDHFKVKAYELGNGHLEVTASRVIAWEEADGYPGWYEDYQAMLAEHQANEDQAEKDAKNRARAARRARTNVRRLCKAMGADTLLTLTYRENVTDLARIKADLKEFARRLKRVLPSFAGVVGFERQERGAWHAHIATAGIPALLPVKGGGDFRSYNVIRAIWRSVTKEAAGNIDVQRRRRHGQKTAAAIAAYLSKYIGKAFEEFGGDGANLWTRYGQVEVPPPVELGTVAKLIDALEVAYSLVGDARQVVRGSLDRWKDWFFLVAENPRSTGAKQRPVGGVE